ncbi:hypothetical protein BH09VER1_BH09VER1_48020 [soil metagenome]
MNETKRLIIIEAVSLWVSLCLVLRLFLVHRKVHWLKKLSWFVVLFLPVIGPLFYGAFFRPLPRHNNGNGFEAYDGTGGHGVGGDAGHHGARGASAPVAKEGLIFPSRLANEGAFLLPFRRRTPSNSKLLPAYHA